MASTARSLSAAAELLIEAGSVLSSSLDATETMSQVAQLTVPELADLCVIDLRAEDGSIRDVAVASADPALAPQLEALRRRLPLDPDGAHPVARVIRSGEPLLIADLTPSLLQAFAAGSEHARFMIDHEYRSSIVVPLRARERNFGALSVLRLGSRAPFAEGDLDVVNELAGRSAMAIDNARLFGELSLVERRLEAILSSLAEAITVEDEDGNTVFANDAATRLLGFGRSDELTAARPGSVISRFLVTDEHGNELGLEDMPGHRLLRGQATGPLLVRNVVRATGEERWLMVRSAPIHDPQTGRLRYAVNAFENITTMKRAELAERFMAEASRVLASSLDYQETLQRVARLAVPRIADWCALDILAEDGGLERVAVHHVDPERLALAEALRRYEPDASGAVAEVVRTAQARLIRAIPDDALVAYAQDEEHLRLLREVGFHSVVIVPLAGPTRTLGAITLVTSGESQRRLTEADVSLTVRLGRRCGTAVENARLYTQRKHIADMLQQALLPATLPQIPGARLESRYTAAGELNDAGGDFYDVLRYGAGWLMMIGDVCGKGARAAACTALARHTLRTAAMNDSSLTEMLGLLHRALREQPSPDDICTVCLVALDTTARGSAQLRVALAGHPPPLLIDAAGSARAIGTPGTLLGAVEPLRISEERVELGPGETLLLYTDGVPETGDPQGGIGEEPLIRICAQAAGAELPDLLAQIEHHAYEICGGRLVDDLALLALRLDP